MSKYFVAYNLDPVSFAACGVTRDDTVDPTEWALGGKPDGWRWITDEEWDELAASSEPSKVIAGWLGLPYQKYLDPDPGSQMNVVELIADGDCAADQPCRFGHRVEDHAVYCHNSRWIDSPRKCRRTQNPRWGKPWPHEECPGFEPNPRLSITQPPTTND